MMTEEILKHKEYIIRQLIDILYSLPDCACGGPLHTFLDDHNVRDEDFVFSYQQLHKPEWALQRGVGLAILHEMAQLRDAERYAVVTRLPIEEAAYSKLVCGNNGYTLEDIGEKI